MKYYRFSLLLTVLFLSSCSNESTSDLIDVPNGEDITYTDDIKPIIEANCIGCHTQPPINGAPMALNSYEDVKTYVENNKIIDRISRDQGAPGMMPLGGTRLPNEVINLFTLWKQQGFRE
jgi:hypothetical protein